MNLPAKTSNFDQSDHVVFTHDDVHSEIVLDCFSQLLLCESFAQNTLLQDWIFNTETIWILAHIFDDLVYMGCEVMHRFSLVILQPDTFLGFVHEFKAFIDVIHGNFIWKSESCLNKEIFTFAWQSRIKASKLRVVMYLSSFLRLPICSCLFSIYLSIKIVWSSSLMVGVKLFDIAM